MKIAGLDIGTTGCKCTVFDENGKYLKKAYRSYPVIRLENSDEIDVSVIMDCVYDAISEMTALYPDIAGIGVTSFGETFVLCDENGRPLHNAMLYTDKRGAEECTELTKKLGAEKIARISGLRPHEMYSVPKLMWMIKNRPEVYAAASRIHLIGDYVVWHLTGVHQIDWSLASRTMGFDIRRMEWSREIFDAAGIDVSLMGKPVPTGTPAGHVTAEAAARTGLSPDTRIVSISHDQVAAAVGAGAFDSSVAVDGAGTVECLTPVYDTMPDADAMFDGFYSAVPYMSQGKYVAYAFSYTGGAILQWFAQELASGEDFTELEGAYVSDCPTGILVLPHFAGAATPYMDTGSKGAVIGLTMSTTKAELYRACMEGVAYEMRLNYEHLLKSGICFTKINATGGGAKSKVWMQMKADVLNIPITALKTADAGTVGSAMLTGIAIGLFRDLADAAEHMIEETETYMPDAERHRQYTEVYERYKRVYHAVRGLV